MPHSKALPGRRRVAPGGACVVVATRSPRSSVECCGRLWRKEAIMASEEINLGEYEMFRQAVCCDRYRPATLMDLVPLLACGHIDHLCRENLSEGNRMKKVIVHKSGTV